MLPGPGFGGRNTIQFGIGRLWSLEKNYHVRRIRDARIRRCGRGGLSRGLAAVTRSAPRQQGQRESEQDKVESGNGIFHIRARG